MNVLDCPGGHNLIIQIPTKGRGSQEMQSQRRRYDNRSRGSREEITSKKCGQPLKAGKSKGDSLTEPPEEHSSADTMIYSSGGLLSSVLRVPFVLF